MMKSMVEAPQGVERKKPLRGGRLGRLRFHRYRVSGCFGGDEFVELVAAADDAGRADGAEFPLGDRLCRLSVGSVQFGERLFGDAVVAPRKKIGSPTASGAASTDTSATESFR